MEGPSLVLLTEELRPFVGRRVVEAAGEARIDFARFQNKSLRAAISWGKHLLLQVDGGALRIHFLMFGSYRINERRERPPRLTLRFARGEINFYTCAVKIIEGDLQDTYDWSVDVMSPAWDARAARRRVRARPADALCDVLMDQSVFSGVGNIIKNEVLFRLRLHPQTPVAKLSPHKLARLVEEAHGYSHCFYEWKKNLELKNHWQVFRKRSCPVCKGALVMAKTGKLQRVSFYCLTCQPIA